MTFSVIGTDTTNQPVHLYKSSRNQHTYIIGGSGTGKSGLLENLCTDDGKQGIGFCLIDPHGQLIDHVIARMPSNREKDVIFLDLKDYHFPFGINIFSCDPTNPLAVQQTVDQVMHIFEKLFEISRTTPLMAQYLRNCTHTIIANPGMTMAEIPLLLQDEKCRKALGNVTDQKVKQFWKTYEALKPTDQKKNADFIINKLDEFLQPLPRNIIGQSTTTIDLAKIMDEGKILLIKLDNLRFPSLTSLIGSMMIALFLNAAASRTKKNLFNIYADEFQNFATEDFVTLIEEARKHHIGITIAHQNRGQLTSKNRQLEIDLKARTLSAKNKIVFQISGQDAEEVVKEFKVERQERPGRSRPQMRMEPAYEEYEDGHWEWEPESVWWPILSRHQNRLK